MECHTYRYLTREENAARGIVTTPALSMNLVRETFHTADLLSMTLNAAGTIAANYPHESDPGELGNCKKNSHTVLFLQLEPLLLVVPASMLVPSTPPTWLPLNLPNM